MMESYTTNYYVYLDRNCKFYVSKYIIFPGTFTGIYFGICFCVHHNIKGKPGEAKLSKSC